MSFNLVKVPCDTHYYCGYVFLHSLVTCDVSWIFSIESFTVWTQFCPEVDTGRETCSQAGERVSMIVLATSLLPYEDCWHQQPVSPLHPELGLTPLLQSKVWTAMTVALLTKQWCDGSNLKVSMNFCGSSQYLEKTPTSAFPLYKSTTCAFTLKNL